MSLLSTSVSARIFPGLAANLVVMAYSSWSFSLTYSPKTLMKSISIPLLRRPRCANPTYVVATSNFSPRFGLRFLCHRLRLSYRCVLTVLGLRPITTSTESPEGSRRHLMEFVTEFFSLLLKSVR